MPAVGAASAAVQRAADFKAGVGIGSHAVQINLALRGTAACERGTAAGARAAPVRVQYWGTARLRRYG